MPVLSPPPVSNVRPSGIWPWGGVSRTPGTPALNNPTQQQTLNPKSQLSRLPLTRRAAPISRNIHLINLLRPHKALGIAQAHAAARKQVKQIRINMLLGLGDRA